MRSDQAALSQPWTTFACGAGKADWWQREGCPHAVPIVSSAATAPMMPRIYGVLVSMPGWSVAAAQDRSRQVTLNVADRRRQGERSAAREVYRPGPTGREDWVQAKIVAPAATGYSIAPRCGFRAGDRG